MGLLFDISAQLELAGPTSGLENGGEGRSPATSRGRFTSAPIIELVIE